VLTGQREKRAAIPLSDVSIALENRSRFCDQDIAQPEIQEHYLYPRTKYLNNQGSFPQ
jgi:hypothetical protein